MPGFVVCASCGTQIKAGRAYCLRCGEALPAPDAPARIPLEVSLGLSKGKQLILGVAASLIVLTLVAVIWQTRPDVADDVAKPFGAPATPRPEATPPATAVGSTAPADPVPAPSGAPATAIDATRGGAAAFNTGNFDAARALYEQALARNPDDAEALNNLGQALTRLGKPAEALPRFERAIALVPTKAAYHFNLGHALGQLSRWDRAIVEYREAVRLFPTDYAAQYNLAMALHKKGDEQAAIPEFQKAIELAPGEASFHLALGMSLEQVGRVPEAVREYRIYLEMAPTAPEAESLKKHLETLAAARPKTSPTF